MSTPTTVDAFLGGRLMIEQPAPGFGYRANADALLLARFAAEAEQRTVRVIDLGAGAGTVALALHTLRPVAHTTFVDIDPMAASLAERNAVRSGLPSYEVIVDDVRRWASRTTHEGPCAVVANPPYTPAGSGRRSMEPGRDVARHGSLEPFTAAIASIVGRTDRHAYLCYAADKMLDLSCNVEAHGLAIHRMRFVHADRALPARIVLIDIAAQSMPVRVLSPWIDEH